MKLKDSIISERENENQTLIVRVMSAQRERDDLVSIEAQLRQLLSSNDDKGIKKENAELKYGFIFLQFRTCTLCFFYYIGSN
jgi:hypothetical protein